MGWGRSVLVSGTSLPGSGHHRQEASGWKMVWEAVTMATPPPGPAPSPTASSCFPKGAQQTQRGTPVDAASTLAVTQD